MAAAMELVYGPGTVMIYADERKMKRAAADTMTPGRVQVLSMNFQMLCKLLLKGTEPFVATNTTLPAIKADVKSPLASAMRYLWMVLDYVADERNQEAFIDWQHTASEYERNSMSYFQSLPLHEHGEFMMTMEQHERIQDYAESALSDEPVQPVHHSKVTDALVTDTTRICDATHHDVCEDITSAVLARIG